MSVCPVVQLRKNPPSPLNRGKRISGTKEKFRKSGKNIFTCSPQSHSLPMQFCIVCYGHIMFVDIAGSSIVGPPISPSPTTGSFGSGLTIANFLQCSLIYIAWILRQLSFSLYVLLQQIRLKYLIIQSQTRLSLLPVGYTIYAYQSPQALYLQSEPISLSLYTLCVYWYRYGSANRSSR